MHIHVAACGKGNKIQLLVLSGDFCVSENSVNDSFMKRVGFLRLHVEYDTQKYIKPHHACNGVLICMGGSTAEYL